MSIDPRRSAEFEQRRAQVEQQYNAGRPQGGPLPMMGSGGMPPQMPGGMPGMPGQAPGGAGGGDPRAMLMAQLQQMPPQGLQQILACLQSQGGPPKIEDQLLW